MKTLIVFAACLLIYSYGYSQNGNIGIGQPTPMYPLSFNGSLGDKISLWTDGSSTHYGFGVQAGFFQMFTKNSSDRIVFGSGSSTAFIEKMRIDENGNVGIGTTSPVNFRLRTAGWISSTIGFDLTDANTNGNTSYNDAGPKITANTMAGNAELDFISPAYDAGPIAFAFLKMSGASSPYIVDAPNPLMVIKRNGYVGIGTANPSTTLDVKGNHRLGGLASYISHDTISGKILWKDSRLFVPSPQYLMHHSASAEGLYYGISQLEYHNQFGSPVFFTNWNNGQGYFSGKLGIGTTTPAFKLDVQNGSINTDSVYRIGGTTVLSVRGTGNLFVGKYAGNGNIGSDNTFSGDHAGYSTNSLNASKNSFFGQSAGYSNTDGSENSFFGQGAGYFNIDGSYNSFFGRDAGFVNVSGYSNSFFGADAGKYNVSGELNSFFGAAAGRSNNTGDYNSFFGTNAGFVNNTGKSNSFFGQTAGYLNSTGSNNSFFGKDAGRSNETGSKNTAVGDSANVNTGVLTNATAIGARSRVDCSNCMVLGSVNEINGATSNVNIGIGTTHPLTKLHIQNGLSGALPFTFSPLAVESNGHTYINLLSPAGNETAILFGQPGSSANGVLMYNHGSTPNGFQFRTNGNSTKMVLDAQGRLGIGNPSPVYTLDVSGNLLFTGSFVNTSADAIGVFGSCNNTPDLGYGVIGQGGYTGVYGQSSLIGAGYRNGLSGLAHSGTYNYGVYALSISEVGTAAYAVYGDAVGDGTTWAGYFVGNVYSTGTYESSDRKLKNDVKALSGALSIIDQLRPSVYTYKTDEYNQMHLPEGLHYGLIADEVQLVMPGAVKKAVQPAQHENHNMLEGKKLSDEVEFDAVNYTEMIPILIAAVKEQQLMIEELKIKNQLFDLQLQQIDELKKLVQELAVKN